MKDKNFSRQRIKKKVSSIGGPSFNCTNYERSDKSFFSELVKAWSPSFLLKRLLHSYRDENKTGV